MPFTEERQTGRQAMDISEICEGVDGITLKHKHTREEMDLLRRKVDRMYHEFVLDKWQEEEEQMSLHTRGGVGDRDQMERRAGS